MVKKAANILLSGALALSVTFMGCGGGTSSTPTGTGSSAAAVTGTATTDAPVTGTVSLKDSSSPAQVRTTTTSGKGSYSLNTNGLKAPYVLKAEWTDSSGSNQMYSIAEGNGRTNINPVSHAAVVAASENDDADNLYNAPSPERYERSRTNFRTIIEQLRTVLAPLFALYQTNDPVSDDEGEGDSEDSGSWIRAMFKDVSFVVKSGTLTVTNKRTGGVIYQAPLRNITSGTFHPENMPGAPGQVNGATLYADKCASCHGPLATSSKKNATAAEIQAAINANTGGMGSLTTLTGLQVQAIATALVSTTTTPPPAPDGAALYASKCSSCHGALATSSKKGAAASAIQTAISNNLGGMGSLSSLTSAEVQAIADALATTTPPPACTYTYSAWGACQSNNTQSRTVASSTPAGCTGTPVLSQACTYVPPVTTCTSFTYSAWGACQSDNTQTRTVASSSPAGCTGGTPVLSQACTYVPPVTTCTSFTYSAWGTCQSDNTQTRTVASSSPAGCTGGTPVLSQACTYVPPTCTSFTYSAWGACQSNNTQTRTVASSSPAGCTGGTPVLSQACTYVPPTCTSFTYSAWGACQSNNTQTRTVASSSPTGCTGGTPVLSQACTYVPPIDGAALYTQYCSGCHGNGKKGKSTTAIQNAINNNTGGMGSLSFLTAAQIAAISAAP